MRSIDAGGFRILSKPDSRASRAILYVEKTKELVLLSSSALNSTFAKRFLLDKFDEDAFNHPIFEKGVNPVRQPFMIVAQVGTADYPSSIPNGVSLNMRGGYRIEANLKTYKSKSTLELKILSHLHFIAECMMKRRINLSNYHLSKKILHNSTSFRQIFQFLLGGDLTQSPLVVKPLNRSP